MMYKEQATRLGILRTQGDKHLEEATKILGDLKTCFEQVVTAVRRGAHPDNLRKLYESIDQGLGQLDYRITQARTRDDAIAQGDQVRNDSSTTLVKPPKTP